MHRANMKLRDYTFLGTTQSFCPQCLDGSYRELAATRRGARLQNDFHVHHQNYSPPVSLIPAKIINRSGRVYFRKNCPTHGVREDFVCSDVRHYDRMEYSLPGKVPAEYGTKYRYTVVNKRTVLVVHKRAASFRSSGNRRQNLWQD